MTSIRLSQRRHLPAIVFMDCDGVIFDVNATKVRAFVEALSEFPPEAQRRMAEHHQAHGGVSRYEKFRWFFREVQPVADEAQAIEAALEKFGAISRAGYVGLEPRAEAIELSARFGAERVFVVSGSDQVELRSVFDDHLIGDEPLRARFAEVLGSPTPKHEHMRRILSERELTGDRALMIGDGSGDFRAARDLGMPFVFLEEMSDWSDARVALAEADDVHVAPTWPTLLGWLET